MSKKRNCKIIQDLLPSYVEKLTNEETNLFIEEHLKECNECKSVLENMQRIIIINTKEEQKKEVKYIKKYSHKLKILKLIIFIIVAIFMIITITKMSIISSLSKKANTSLASTNYHEESISYEGDSLVNTNIYYKDGKKVVFLERINKNGVSKVTIYKKGEKENIYQEIGNEKIAILNQENGLQYSIAYNDIKDYNIFSLFLTSIFTNIKEEECNGVPCYFLNSYNSSLSFYQGAYISKDTGLVVRYRDGNLINTDTGRKVDLLRDIYYEFDIVTDDIFTEPNLSDYKIK